MDDLHKDEKLLYLRAKYMARIHQLNAEAEPLGKSGSMAQTCLSIELSGTAKGLLEAVSEIDAVLFNIKASNDNQKN
jgi:hypothetical protein